MTDDYFLTTKGTNKHEKKSCLFFAVILFLCIYNANLRRQRRLPVPRQTGNIFISCQCLLI